MQYNPSYLNNIDFLSNTDKKFLEKLKISFDKVKKIKSY